MPQRCSIKIDDCMNAEGGALPKHLPSLSKAKKYLLDAPNKNTTPLA